MRIQRFALCTLVFFAGLWCTPMSSTQAADTIASTKPDALTLDEALDHASQNRQEFASFRADLGAAALKLKHASLPPNPELGVEWNNLGGNLPAGDAKETKVSLNQRVEIGGKPSARENRGHAEIMQLQRQQAMAWLDIVVEVRLAFLEVLNARERLTLQHETAQIASELAGIAHEQVAAGKIAATEETRAEARKAETKAEIHKLNRLLAEAELNLAAVLVIPDRAAVTAKGRIPREVGIPDQQTLLAGMKNSPLLALRRSETRLATTNLSLEQANTWGDPTLSLAVREVPDENARAVSIGVSIPLPLFQRNQTALAEAGATASKATANEVVAARRLRTELSKAHTVLVAADQEARTLQNEVLSRAAEAAEAVQEGFRVGKFRYSDVLEASQALVAMKGRYLDVILDLNRAAITLDRLLGKPAVPENFTTTSYGRSNP